MKIRNCELSDIDIIYEFICRLEDQVLDKSKFTNLYKNNLLNSNIYYFVVEDEHRIIGFISVYIQDLLHHNDKIAEIQELYLDESSRGKGLGSILIKETEKLARKLDIYL